MTRERLRELAEAVLSEEWDPWDGTQGYEPSHEQRAFMEAASPEVVLTLLGAARADRDGLREAAGLPQFPATDASAALIRSAIQSGSGTSPSFDDTLALALRDFDAIWNWCRAVLTAEAEPRT